MRLICPECNALYDIADAMIPPEGREVECSACGHVWLQLPATPARTAPVRDAGADRTAPATTAGDAVSARKSGNVVSGTMRGLSADLRAAAQSHADAAPDLGEAPILQRPLPDDVLSILREETARELGARRGGVRPAPDVTAPTAVEPAPSEAPMMTPDALEAPAERSAISRAEEPAADWPATTVTRPDLRPDAESPRVAPVADRPSTATVTAPVAVPAATPAPAHEAVAERPPVPRRRVPRGLPDAEQLAATIQTEVPAPAPAVIPAPVMPPQSGYRTGFLRALSVAAALLVAYVAGAAWVQSGRAPEAVVSLVGGVDHVRAGLQDAVTSILGRKEP